MENKVNLIWHLNNYLDILMIYENKNKSSIEEVLTAIKWLESINKA